MLTTPNYPLEWLEQIPATVFAVLRTGEIHLTLFPGVGMIDGGVPMIVPIELIPFELRMPNTRLWIRCDEKFNVLRVWHREADSIC